MLLPSARSLSFFPSFFRHLTVIKTFNQNQDHLVRSNENKKVHLVFGDESGVLHPRLLHGNNMRISFSWADNFACQAFPSQEGRRDC
jgi:hypothetical protein